MFQNFSFIENESIPYNSLSHPILPSSDTLLDILNNFPLFFCFCTTRELGCFQKKCLLYVPSAVVLQRPYVTKPVLHKTVQLQLSAQNRCNKHFLLVKVNLMCHQNMKLKSNQPV